MPKDTYLPLHWKPLPSHSYVYIFREKQVELMNALTSADGSSPLEPNHHIVILWRTDKTRLKYEWVEGGWEVDESEKHNASRELLRDTVHRLLHSNNPMSYEAVVQVGDRGGCLRDKFMFTSIEANHLTKLVYDLMDE